ncbi:MAG TPA: 16S rRNA (guanine(527)-N(7))-methyltransferase RsmG [Oscillatoriaceae cyanobacterium]
MDSWHWFQQEAAALGVPVTDEQRDRFARYHALLVEANRTTNLTRITDLRDAILKHYLDSLLFLRLVPSEWTERPIRLVDVGAGAGLPGIPLLIARPNWSGVLMDAVGKKVAFMAGAMEALGLSGEARHARAEDLGHDPAFRERFDLGVARAVAGLPELLELTLPLVKPDGRLVVSKGAKGPEELEAAKPALKTLNAAVSAAQTLQLPEEAGERYLYAISKRGATPRAYPRKPGIPHRKPLC